MKIIILGAGAVGSYYGAKLSEKNDVLLIAKSEHAFQINKNKLALQGAESKKYPVKASTKIDSVEKSTIILLTTKAYDNEKTIQSIKDKIRKDTVIICMQNGYGVEDIVLKVVGKRCLVLRAITSIGVAFKKPGIVKVNHHGKTIIEKSVHSEKIREMFVQSGLECAISKNIKEDIWKKVIVNCLVNPLSAILKVKNKEIIVKELEPLLHAVADECIAVAKKEGIVIERKYVEGVLLFLKTSENTSSMLQDVLRKKKTEIEFLNGAVVRLGRGYGINCPANEMLSSMIRFLEKKDKSL